MAGKHSAAIANWALQKVDRRPFLVVTTDQAQDARMTCADIAVTRDWTTEELAETLHALGLDPAGFADAVTRGIYVEAASA